MLQSTGLTRCALLAFCCLGGPLPAAQERPQQRVVLTNPTPREPDLEKRFYKEPPKTDPARLAAFRQQRLELTGQASRHLHEMSTVLEESMGKEQAAARVAQEAKLLQSIETLAGNVYQAMSAAPPPARKDSSAAGPEAGLPAEARRLTELTAALQYEISRSTVDTLPAGVLLKSAEVKQLAGSLRQRLQPNRDASAVSSPMSR